MSDHHASDIRADQQGDSEPVSGSSSQTDGLRFLHRPGEMAGRVQITAQDGDEVVFVDDIKIASSRSRMAFIKNIERLRPNADGDEIEKHLLRIAAELSSQEKAQETELSREQLLAQLDETTAEQLLGTPSNVLKEAREVLLDPRLIDHIMRDIQAVGVVGEQTLAGTVYTAAISRKLQKPVSTITQGVTSSGKSFVLEQVARLTPAEDLLLATDITTNALYYMSTGALIHRVVIAGERPRGDDDDRAVATRALREMISSGELRKVVPIKGDNGRMQSAVLWQPGPISFHESTTSAQVFDEDANRCILLSTDETAEQTARIVAAQAARAAGEVVEDASVIARHHAMQRMLMRCRVHIPYARALASKIPTHRQDARRAMPQVFSMVQAVALLHQLQRCNGPVNHGTIITATVQDYVIARQFLIGPMGRSLGGGLPSAVARFGERIKVRFGTEEFSSSEVLESEPVLHTKGKVNEYLKSLSDAGVVECVEPSKGAKPARWRVIGEVPDAGAIWLPTVDQLREGCP